MTPDKFGLKTAATEEIEEIVEHMIQEIKRSAKEVLGRLVTRTKTEEDKKQTQEAIDQTLEKHRKMLPQWIEIMYTLTKETKDPGEIK